MSTVYIVLLTLLMVGGLCFCCVYWVYWVVIYFLKADAFMYREVFNTCKRCSHARKYINECGRADDLRYLDYFRVMKIEGREDRRLIKESNRREKKKYKNDLTSLVKKMEE